MRAELRNLHSFDALNGLESFAPDDPHDFGIGVRAIVGPAGTQIEESFDFTVCTARWLESYSLEKGFAFLHSHLLVSRWDLGVVTRAISDLCRNAEGESWEDVALTLSRFGYWEFDSYRE